MNTHSVWEQAKTGIAGRQPRRHFEFTTLSGAVLFLALAASLVLYYAVSGQPAATDAALLAASAVGAGLIAMLVPYWPVVIVTVGAAWVALFFYSAAPDSPAMVASLALLSIGILLAPAFQVVKQWQKAVVLRLGRFRRVLQPGPRVIRPLTDTIVRYVDMRIRVTDFSAEKSITRDTVPVHVDALAFWMVWDAEKAILEVENYFDAVTLSAQTALRDAIGRNDLATLLSERERLGSEIQTTLDAKTNPWGITILSIEFKEVLVPKELEDALSRKAQAERERQSRVILGSAEVEIAQKFEEAAETYRDNPTAFQLRAMNMVYDSIRTNKNMVLMPSSALDSMNLGTALSAAAFAQNISRQTDTADADDSAGTEH